MTAHAETVAEPLAPVDSLKGKGVKIVSLLAENRSPQRKEQSFTLYSCYYIGKKIMSFSRRERATM